MIKYDRYVGGKRYAATFSYDDGGAADRRLVELFNKYNMKCTFNLISSSLIKTDGTGIKTAELKDLYAGHEIACHSYSHPHLERMSVQDQYDELIRDRQIIEGATGRIIRGLAYPFGTYNTDTTFTAMKTASLVYGRTATSTGTFELPSDFRIWNPTTHHNECEPFVKKFKYNVEKAIWRAGGVLYIWGHSYEFDNKDYPVQWDKFEEILASLAEDADGIWFATNIEIYDYVNALKALRRSADGKTFCNPTDTDLWISVDDQPLKIPKISTVTI